MRIENLYCSPNLTEGSRFWLIGYAFILSVLTLLTLPASGEDLPVEPREYPSESLRLADELAPQLAEALRSCDAKSAENMHRRVNEFLYHKWNWNEHFEKLKQYRACFQMLSDIAATSRIVTDRNLAASQYHLVAGMFDANYQECSSVAGHPTKTKDSQKFVWPERFGKEPERNACFAAR